MRIIRGYRQGQQGGGCLVTIDDAVLPMPAIDPKTEARHSPTGFSFGYAGSGPAELARAILVTLYPADPLVRRPAVYQAFKFDVVAQLNGDGFRLTSEEIDRWYQGWRTAHPDQVAQEEDRRTRSRRRKTADDSMRSSPRSTRSSRRRNDDRTSGHADPGPRLGRPDVSAR